MGSSDVPKSTGRVNECLLQRVTSSDCLVMLPSYISFSQQRNNCLNGFLE